MGSLNSNYDSEAESIAFKIFKSLSKTCFLVFILISKPKYLLIWDGCFYNPKKQPHSQQLSAGRKNNFLIKFTLFAVSQLTRMIEIVFGGEMPLKKLLIS